WLRLGLPPEDGWDRIATALAEAPADLPANAPAGVLS
ncbi:MAG TPA: threonine-phosphate decarboxylase, partial [Roseovarius nubinhibens]|nr:threonine-phosphate decarboxylase [Roseovarius nubinhibens]